MNHTFGDHAVEWCGDAKVGFEIILRPYGGFHGDARLLLRADQRLRGFLQAIVSARRGGAVPVGYAD